MGIQRSGPTGSEIIREFMKTADKESAMLFERELARSLDAGPIPFNPATPMGRAIMEMRRSMVGLIYLQYSLAMSNTSLISNMLKARHDTAKNAVGNVR